MAEIRRPKDFRNPKTEWLACWSTPSPRFEQFKQAIQLARGNLAKAARWLGVTCLKTREKLTQFGLHPAAVKNGASNPCEPARLLRFVVVAC